MATQFVNCTTCNTPNDSRNTVCLTCGNVLPSMGGPMQPMYAPKPVGSDKKVAAGLCGILLGGFGVHKFILGYQNEGVIMLAVYLVGFVSAFFTCGLGILISLAIGIIGLVEGIMYLTKSDEEFSQTYIINKKPWF